MHVAEVSRPRHTNGSVHMPVITTTPPDRPPPHLHFDQVLNQASGTYCSSKQSASIEPSTHSDARLRPSVSCYHDSSCVWRRHLVIGDASQSMWQLAAEPTGRRSHIQSELP